MLMIFSSTHPDEHGEFKQSRHQVHPAGRRSESEVPQQQTHFKNAPLDELTGMKTDQTTRRWAPTSSISAHRRRRGSRLWSAGPGTAGRRRPYNWNRLIRNDVRNDAAKTFMEYFIISCKNMKCFRRSSVSVSNKHTNRK